MNSSQSILDGDAESLLECNEAENLSQGSPGKQPRTITLIFPFSVLLFLCFFAQNGWHASGASTSKYPIWLSRPSSSKDDRDNDTHARRVRAQQVANHSWEDEVVVKKNTVLKQNQPTKSWAFHEKDRGTGVDSSQSVNKAPSSNSEKIPPTEQKGTDVFESVISILDEGATRLRRKNTMQSQHKLPTQTWNFGPSRSDKNSNKELKE